MLQDNLYVFICLFFEVVYPKYFIKKRYRLTYPIALNYHFKILIKLQFFKVSKAYLDLSDFISLTHVTERLITAR